MCSCVLEMQMKLMRLPQKHKTLSGFQNLLDVDCLGQMKIKKLSVPSSSIQCLSDNLGHGKLENVASPFRVSTGVEDERFARLVFGNRRRTLFSRSQMDVIMSQSVFFSSSFFLKRLGADLSLRLGESTACLSSARLYSSS